jgi:hypothetical protein
MKKNHLKAVIGALLIGGTALNTMPTYAAADNQGKEFLMSFLPNYNGVGQVELHLTGDVATSVTVEYPINAPTFTQTVAITPGTVTVVSLPYTASQQWTAGIAQNNSVRASASDEFVAYMINRQPYTSDAGLALPVDVLNNDYIVSTWTPSLAFNEFAVTAAFDATTVTITPNQSLVGGFGTGVPFTVTLNRGEAFYGQGTATGALGELSGTIIKSDKPVAMTNGDNCDNIPNGQTSACDHIFEVAQPVQTWGKSVIAAPLPLRPSGSPYRIVASEDATTVLQDGLTLGTINRGQYIDTPVTPGAIVFSADKAIFVSQFMTGVNYPGNTTGDPSQGNVIPTEQFLKSYTFSTVGGSQFASNYVTIIAEDTDVNAGTILLDSVPLSASDFTPIPGTIYSYANELLTSGSHTTQTQGFHGINVSGFNQADSYLYPGGAKFQSINPVGDANAPILVVTPSGTTATGSATDNRPSEDINNNGILDPGEDLNGNGKIDKDTGIFKVELDPASVNLVLTVPSFVPGAPVVNFTLSASDPSKPASGTVITTDGAGNTSSKIVSLQNLAPKGDSNPPICGLTSNGDTATGSATDNRPSEDLNNNGILDPGEDLNGNGQIDIDTGIASIVLNPSSTNLALNVSPFSVGAPVVNYSVTLLDATKSGAGNVTATDGAGNPCAANISLVSKPVNPIFASFGARVEVNKKHKQVEVEGGLMLSSTSDGANPQTEAVSFDIGGIHKTIPAGSFRLNHHNQTYTFEGLIDGTKVEFIIKRLAVNSFSYEIELYGIDTKSIPKHVDVKLSIGNDSGTATQVRVDQETHGDHRGR